KLAAKWTSDWRAERAKEAEQFASALDAAKADEAAEAARLAEEQARVERDRVAAQKAEQDRAQAEAAQRQAAAIEQHSMSLAEHQAANEIQDIRNWLPAAYSQAEIANPHLIQDPERREYFDLAVQRHKILLGGLQQAQAVRQAENIRNAAIHQHNV